jgi:Domain of unknown function (DUF222)
MTAAEKRQALIALARGEERLRALRLQVMAAAGDVSDEAGARSTGALVAHLTRRDARAAAADGKLAETLDRRFPLTREAWRRGEVNGDQAAVIARTLTRVGGSADPDQLARAEEHLVDQAGHFGPDELARLGARIWEVICPGEAEAREAEALARAERDARAQTRVNLKRCGDGSTLLSARIPDEVAGRLRRLLDAYTSPRREHVEHDGVEARDPATGERLPRERLLGQALCALVEHADPDKLPKHGCMATTVLVTMPLQWLREQVGHGSLCDGSLLSAAEARRLACNGSIIPAVLDGESRILDLGHASRLFDRHQRVALEHRDRHCRAEGCTIPAAWCEAHHLTPWSHGAGPTWRMACCCAPSTITGPTTSATR